MSETPEDAKHKASAEGSPDLTGLSLEEPKAAPSTVTVDSPRDDISPNSTTALERTDLAIPSAKESEEVSATDGTDHQDIPEAHSDTSQTKKTSKPRKSVGFAPEPEEELRELHKEQLDRQKESLKSNPFWKVPPELSYLDPKPSAPKPLPSTPSVKAGGRPRKAVDIDDIPDLPSRAVKEIAVVNKKTALNFNFHEVVLPIGPDRLLVEVKYCALSSFDLSKIQEYTFNVSNEKIGLGFDYVGEIVQVGKKFKDHDVFKKGTKVFGVTNPADKKGSLQTCVIINPRDVIIPITEEDFEKMSQLDLTMAFDCASPFQIEEGVANSDVTKTLPNKEPVEQKKKKNSFEVENVLPDIGKFAIFGSQYCRAKQALSPLSKIFAQQRTANILINGADTNLGYTLMQVIASSVYKDILDSFNVTLVVQEKNVESVKGLATYLGSGGYRKFNVVAYDMQNEDLVLPGEIVPINYKKVPFFATEVIESMLKILPESEKVNKKNISSSKLDLFIDIVGSRKMFQKEVSMSKIDQVNFPFKERLENGVKPSSLFGTMKEPLFLKLLKSKSRGSAFVSFCDFNLSEPSYSIDQLVKFKGAILDPWASSWTSGIANSVFSKYNYYEKFHLEIKQAWVEEAFRLAKNGELRMNLDVVVDWRNDFRKQISNLRKHDGAIVFKLETF